MLFPRMTVMRGNLSSPGQEERRRIAMASEAEFAEGGFKQLASVSSTMDGMLPAAGPTGAAIGMVLTEAGFVVA
jgi:hypothetical protein